MRWFRSNRTWGGPLTLLSLALQIAVAFGHLHLKDISGGPGFASTIAAAAPDAAFTPTDKNSIPGDDDYCAICITHKLLGSSFGSAPPALPLPLIHAGARLAADNSTAAHRLPHVFFQSRAPPIA